MPSSSSHPPLAKPLTAYKGDVSAAEAWDHLAHDPQAQLVDVRSVAEWQFVGEPDLSALGKTVIKLSWKNSPDFSLNPHFTELFTTQRFAKNAPLFFLCRSGGRSAEAALAVAGLGFTRCHNIHDGFEGDANAEGHRGQRSGWKAARLPWRQS